MTENAEAALLPMAFSLAPKWRMVSIPAAAWPAHVLWNGPSNHGMLFTPEFQRESLRWGGEATAQ